MRQAASLAAGNPAPTNPTAEVDMQKFQSQALISLIFTFLQLGSAIEGLFDAPTMIRPATRDLLLQTCKQLDCLHIAANLFRFSPRSTLGSKHQLEAIAYFSTVKGRAGSDNESGANETEKMELILDLN